MNNLETYISWPIIIGKGWKDLGKINGYYSHGKDTEIVCSVCNVRIRTARKDNKIIKYCPRCLVYGSAYDE